MAKRHLVLCGGVRQPMLTAEWKAAHELRLALGKGRHDVHLRLEHLSRRLCANLPDVAADLVELAAYVYSADQAVTRGGPVEIEYGERWRRHFRFEVPVRRPAIWRSTAVKEVLTQTLSFLSDDDYEFHFTRHPDPPPLGRYLFGDVEPDTGMEEVVLFSGEWTPCVGPFGRPCKDAARSFLSAIGPTPRSTLASGTSSLAATNASLQDATIPCTSRSRSTKAGYRDEPPTPPGSRTPARQRRKRADCGDRGCGLSAPR